MSASDRTPQNTPATVRAMQTLDVISAVVALALAVLLVVMSTEWPFHGEPILIVVALFVAAYAGVGVWIATALQGGSTFVQICQVVWSVLALALSALLVAEGLAEGLPVYFIAGALGCVVQAILITLVFAPASQTYFTRRQRTSSP